MDRLGIDMQTVFGLPPVDQVKLAAELNCSHISTGLAPVPWKLDQFPAWSLREADTRREMTAAMRDLGISLSVVEGFAVRPRADARDRVADLDLAAELGAERASAVCMEPDLARGLDQLAILADLTAERGMMLTLEFAPPHAINTLTGALAALRAVDKPNVRLVIDAMHFFRSGGAIADLKAVDPELIGYVQLCDAPRTNGGEDYFTEACFSRRCPGEGELPLREFILALPSDVPIGLEVPMLAEIEQGGLEAAVRRITSAARRLTSNTNCVGTQQ